MAVIMMVMVQWCGGVNDKCSIGGDGGGNKKYHC